MSTVQKKIKRTFSQRNEKSKERPERTSTMVTRSRIVASSRSRNDHNLPAEAPIIEKGVWVSKEKLIKDHLREVATDLWYGYEIDDKSWAKVFVFEKNRVVAKGFVRDPVLSVNGSDIGFDGFRIGLNGFKNPKRDSETENALRHVGLGMLIKIDRAGNIVVRRILKKADLVKAEGSAVSNDVSQLTNDSAFVIGKALMLFHAKKFFTNFAREFSGRYPDGRKLEVECVSAISFAKHESPLLDCPSWIMIINLGALKMVKAGMRRVQDMMSLNRERIVFASNDGPLPAPNPPVHNGSQDICNKPKIPLPRGDEDNKTVDGNKAGLRNNKRPKLPPGDLNIPKPEDDDTVEEEPRIKPVVKSSRTITKEKPYLAPDGKYHTPYYYGLQNNARIPEFVAAAYRSRPVRAAGVGREIRPARRSTFAERSHRSSFRRLPNPNGVLEIPVIELE